MNYFVSAIFMCKNSEQEDKRQIADRNKIQEIFKINMFIKHYLVTK